MIRNAGLPRSRYADRPRQLPYGRSGIGDFHLIVILDQTHEVHTDGARRKACPSSSEVLAGFVRTRTCPSSSEVPTGSVRRKGKGANPSSSEVPGDEQEGHLEDVRKRAVCSPSSSEVPAAVAVSPPLVGVTRQTTTSDVNNHRSTTEIKNLSSSWAEAVDMHIERHTKNKKRHMTCKSNVGAKVVCKVVTDGPHGNLCQTNPSFASFDAVLEFHACHHGTDHVVAKKGNIRTNRTIVKEQQ